jgi:archaellin
VLTYIDQDQAETIPPTTNWSTSWLSGSGELLDPGERVDFDISLVGVLATPLTVSRQFTIRVQPTAGAPLIITRTTPAELTAVVNMQ